MNVPDGAAAVNEIEVGVNTPPTPPSLGVITTVPVNVDSSGNRTVNGDDGTPGVPVVGPDR